MTLPFVILLAILPFQWSPVGPERGTVTAIAIGETTLAGTAEGRVFRWNGDSWIAAGRYDGPIHDIQIAGDDEWVLAGDTLVQSGRIAATNVRAFALAPSDAGVVKVAFEGQATSIAIDAVDSSLVWATRPDGDLEKSSDGGATWTSVALPPSVIRVQAHPRRPNTAWAIGADGRGYRTTDGVNWKELFYLTGRLVFDPSRDDHFYVLDDVGRLFHSDDDGDWIDVIHGGRIYSMAFDRDGSLLAGFREEGVMRSSDGGHQWVPQRSGLRAAEIHSLAATADGSTIYAGSVNTMFRSTNSGATWDPVFELRYLLPGPFQTISIDPLNPQHVWIGHGTGLWYTSDGGTRFNRRFYAEHKEPQHVVASAFDPADRDRDAIFVLLTESFFHFDVASNEQIEIALPDGRFHALSVGETIWIAGERDGQALLLHSTDRGASWSEVPVTGSAITALHTGSQFIAGTSTGEILQSSDAGQSWRKVATLPAGVTSIATDGTNLFAAAEDVYASSDGMTWLPVSGSMTEETTTTLTSSSPMFAGTAGGGVYIGAPGTPRQRAVRR